MEYSPAPFLPENRLQILFIAEFLGKIVAYSVVVLNKSTGHFDYYMYCHRAVVAARKVVLIEIYN